MKRYLIAIFISLLIISFNSYAQSDYEKVEGFKKAVSVLMNEIKNAESLVECGEIQDKIEQLKIDNNSNKTLLDQALYPDNFDSSINGLLSALETRASDFSQMAEMNDEIISLKEEIKDLGTENLVLINQIDSLYLKSEKDEAEIARLGSLVEQLRSNIEKRDKLVRGIIDSLLVDFVRSPQTLDDIEKQNIMGRVENRSLFYNIERVISDNMDYLKVTEMTSEDFMEMKNQYKAFRKAWNQLGEKLGEVYLNRRERLQEISYISNLFGEWSTSLDKKVWTTINRLFKEKEIVLMPFNNGIQFTNSILAFIDAEINNIGLKTEEELENKYDKFLNGVYYQSVQPVWMPLLIENEMLEPTDKNAIESKIADWENNLFPAPDLTWLYIILFIIIVSQLVFYFRRKAKNKS